MYYRVKILPAQLSCVSHLKVGICSAGYVLVMQAHWIALLQERHSAGICLGLGCLWKYSRFSGQENLADEG